jgi:hypothetical protein
MISFHSIKSFAQATSGGTALTPNRPNVPGTDYIGWDFTVAVPLMIRCDNTFSSGTVDPSIQFWISGVQYMWIDGNTKNAAVGAAINVNPPYKLTVESDVDVECQNTSTTPWNEGYRYNGDLILCAPISSQNIFVGLGSGSNTTGSGNSFVGLYSGNTNTTGEDNTFLG